MIDGGTHLPVRWVSAIGLPVGMKGEIGRKHLREDAEHRWEDEPIACVPVQEPVANKDASGFQSSVCSLSDRLPSKGIVALGQTTGGIQIATAQGSTYSRDRGAFLRHCLRRTGLQDVLQAPVAGHRTAHPLGRDPGDAIDPERTVIGELRYQSLLREADGVHVLEQVDQGPRMSRIDGPEELPELPALELACDFSAIGEPACCLGRE